MVRGGHHLHTQRLGDSADVAGTLAEDIDDSQPQRLGEGFEQFRTMVRLQIASHRDASDAMKRSGTADCPLKGSRSILEW